MSEHNGNHQAEQPEGKEQDVWQELLRRYRDSFPDPSALERGMQDILRRAERKRRDDAESE